MQEHKLMVFEMDDCTWWIGYGLQSTWEAYLGSFWQNDPSDYEIEQARQLSDDELKTTRYTPDEGKTYHSFEDELNIQKVIGGEFPRFFATTEW